MIFLYDKFINLEYYEIRNSLINLKWKSTFCKQFKIILCKSLNSKFFEFRVDAQLVGISTNFIIFLLFKKCEFNLK